MCRAIYRNERFASVLKDLTGHVEDGDRARIESVLHDVSRIDRRTQDRNLYLSTEYYG
jgi:hypothetical protein